MDGTEKAAIWLVVITMLMILVIFGVGIWGFIEFIQWITSK